MISNIIDIKRIEQLSLNDDNIQLNYKVIKVAEEAGEVMQEFLAFDKSPNASKSAKGTAMSVIEEAYDTINCSMDVILKIMRNNSNVSETEVRELFKSKLDKWESKQK